MVTESKHHQEIVKIMMESKVQTSTEKCKDARWLLKPNIIREM
jgi:hypothetical protein